VLTAIRNEIARHELQETFASRDNIKRALLKELDESTEPWGIKVTDVDIKDITPSDDMRKSLEAERAAESMKAAAIQEAQGKRDAQIAIAESRREAAIQEAEGMVKAVELISAAIRQQPGNQQVLREVVKFLVAQRYVDASQKIGESNNSKVIFMDPKSLNDALDEMILDQGFNNLPGSGRPPSNN
ncbi:MAG: SPFH domain-containing protein, partial [Cyanobacteria bacterium P01_H01_bin.121]